MTMIRCKKCGGIFGEFHVDPEQIGEVPHPPQWPKCPECGGEWEEVKGEEKRRIKEQLMKRPEGE